MRLLQRHLSADAPETELSVILLLLRFRNVEERRWDIGVGDGHGGGTERPPEMVLEYSFWRFTRVNQLYKRCFKQVMSLVH